MACTNKKAAGMIRSRIVYTVVSLVIAGWSDVSQVRASEARSAHDSSSPSATAPVLIELREGLAVSLPLRDRRAAITTDPIAAQVIAGKWKVPRAGEAAVTADGQTSRWEPIKAGADGAFARVGSRYIAFAVSSPDEAVMMLEASGHAMVTVGAEPHVGDTYANGVVHIPVRLHKGESDFLFQTGRGRFEARLTRPKASAFLNPTDVTVPDLIAGVRVDSLAAVVVANATGSWRDDLVISAKLPDGTTTETAVPSLMPLSARKVGFGLRGSTPQGEGDAKIELKLRRKPRSVSGRDEQWETLDTSTITLRVRRAEQTHKRTFRSAIDGSVQYYAVVPAMERGADSKMNRPGLVLTLHGAAVEAIGQADAYAAKPGLHIVAPTNRRPYGFDWEDWGRLDAIEVLDLAERTLNTDPRRTYLTGHSMGGHGTWHLGVNYPGRFAAIAPSAGWISMWSYAGATRPESRDPVSQLLARGTLASDTLAMLRNTRRIGVYVLHGDADDNVPVGQARQMRKILGEFHPDFAYHEQPGAGHWWGSPCVDWPPLFAFLEQHTLPATETVRRIDFVTASPSVSARSYWATIEEQIKSFVPSSVHLAFDPARLQFRGTTENVGRLTLDVGRALGDLKTERPVAVELDGQTIANAVVSKSSSGAREIWLTRSGGTWSALRSAVPSSRKSPSRQGPFKEAFRNRFLLVIGTKGTPEENAWGLAKARFDAEVFWYRGNGSVDAVLDTDFLNSGWADQYRDRNVIVYGHAESNAAWPELLGESPVQVRRGQVRIGQRTFTGDNLACLFVRPRPASDRASVGVVAGSGLTGLRLTDRLPYFTAGVAYPDCLLLSEKSLTESPAGILAAGYFGGDWSVNSGEFAWKE
jgi:poly(3-hydroxybutyrate) depolymerase